MKSRPAFSVPLFRIILYAVITGLSFASQFEDGTKYSSSTGKLKRETQQDRCLLPPPLENGNYRPSHNRCPTGDARPECLMIPGTSVPHNWVIYFGCDPGYKLNTTKTVSVCLNGKWRPSLPTCWDYSSSISVKLLLGKKKGVSVIDMSISEQTVFLNYTQEYSSIFSPSVDYHYAKKYIFYASVDRIYRDEMVNLVERKGTPKVVVTAGMVGPVRMAVDWVHDRIYWLSDTHRSVESTSLDGSNRTFIFNVVPNLFYPHNIGVDPYAGYIFVASNSSIWRTKLDGTGLTRLKLDDEQGKMVRCLAVDVRKKRIFFAYRVLNIGITYIGSCDYEGRSGRDHPLVNRDSFVDIFTLDIHQDTLFFGHYTENTDTYMLYSVNLTKSMPLVPVLEQNVARGFSSLRVYHPSIQQDYHSPRPGRTKY